MQTFCLYKSLNRFSSFCEWIGYCSNRVLLVENEKLISLRRIEYYARSIFDANRNCDVCSKSKRNKSDKWSRPQYENLPFANFSVWIRGKPVVCWFFFRSCWFRCNQELVAELRFCCNVRLMTILLFLSTWRRFNDWKWYWTWNEEEKKKKHIVYPMVLAVCVSTFDRMTDILR